MYNLPVLFANRPLFSLEVVGFPVQSGGWWILCSCLVTTGSSVQSVGCWFLCFCIVTTGFLVQSEGCWFLCSCQEA